MSLRTRCLIFLLLAGSLVALPSCNPVPVLLLNLNGLSMNSSRVYFVVIQGNSSGKATFQREDMTNKWLFMESETRPPQSNCPPTAQFALELPRGTGGAAAISVQVDPPGAMPLPNQPPPTVTPVAGACLRVTLEDGSLNSLDVPLLPMGPPPNCN